MDGNLSATENDKTFTDAELEQIRTDLKTIKDSNITWERISRESGIPQGTISQFATSKYAGDNQKLAGRIQMWLFSRSEKEAQSRKLRREPEFQNTPTAQKFTEILRFAHTLPDIVVIAGVPGVGKTSALKNYAANNANVYMATMKPSTSSVNTMLNTLARAMGVHERSQSKLSGAIGARIEDAGALIIVDEAQHLSSAALDELRSFHDQYGTGLALVGNTAIYTQLEGGGRQTSFAQLFSRIGMRITQAKPVQEDVCMLLDAWEVPDNLRRTLKAIAAKPGALRVLNKTLTLAYMLAAGSDNGITEAHVKAAYERLSTESGNKERA